MYLYLPVVLRHLHKQNLLAYFSFDNARVSENKLSNIFLHRQPIKLHIDGPGSVAVGTIFEEKCLA